MNEEAMVDIALLKSRMKSKKDKVIEQEIAN